MKNPRPSPDRAPGGPCSARRTRYSAWLDGELDLAAREALHLDVCTECRSFVAHVRATSRALCGDLPGAPSETAWTTLSRALATERSPGHVPPIARGHARRPAFAADRRGLSARIAAALVGCASILVVARASDPRDYTERGGPHPASARLAHAVHTLIHDRAQVADARTLAAAPLYRAVVSAERRDTR